MDFPTWCCWGSSRVRVVGSVPAWALTQALHHDQYQLAITAAAFAAGRLSDAKVRTLTRVATLIALLTTLVWKTRPARNPDGTWPTLAQPHADALAVLVSDRVGRVDTEIVLHVRGDGASCDDGIPITDTVIALLHYDHNPPFHHTRRTVVDVLELRCAPCHRQRHHQAS